ncbi:MAG: metallophosphoesterase family protein [Sedimentisphaerales bacterium]|nr:metallophosphoesterase family protein [Sedimentisphaerales bacterium]
MNKIHPNRLYLEEYRTKKHKYAKDGFFTSLTRIHKWSAIIHFILKITGLADKGLANAQNLQLTRTTVELENLPENFDNCRILFISDFHIEGLESIPDNIIRLIENLEYDYCMLGGDYNHYNMMHMPTAKQRMKKIVEHLKCNGIYGILGNHDYYEIGVFLQSIGVTMLINEHITIERNGQTIYLAGLDDCYIFDSADIGRATKHIPSDAFKILLCHSPQIYKQALKYGFNLQLSGHTHAGQICLPGGIAIFKGVNIPRKIVKGLWNYKNLTGYTSSGVGSSGNVTARFFCLPEIALLTLKTKK